ncbi:MAG TPA: SDR family oxidoreductase [Vicinamibacterales bacterium]|nr:SDR family oxidoreductase [Vicinamibacterales bacterium]
MRRGTKLKKLREQVVVITGASSGIGLATARMAASRGARVLLTSRNERDLARVTQEIRARGGNAAFAVADVADPEAVERVADAAVREFGAIDTWVNNAGVSIYGKLIEVPLEDKRRMFETNFWGVVHGCRTAIKHLRTRGGAIVNIGSIVSDLAIPLQGMYSASKHAVLGYTNALRLELEHDRLPISVSLVKPSAIDTPFLDHARNYMDAAPNFPPPVYEPDLAARAILRCAERRIRDVTVGGGGRIMTAIGRLAPRAMDRYLEAAMFRQQRDPDRPARRPDSLFEPSRDGLAHGPYSGRVMKSSAYTTLATSSVARALPFIAAGVVLAAVSKGAVRPAAATGAPRD